MATTSPSHRNTIPEILRSLSETLFWGVTASGLILFSLASLLQLLQLPSETFTLFLALRLFLAGLAVAALLWRSVGNELSRMAAPAMMILVMSERVFELGWLGPESVSVGSLDYAALLFLAAGAVYRGESRRWWSTLMPWAILNQLILLMEFSQKAGVKTNDLIQSGLIIGIGFIGTCVFFAIRSARVVESQAVYDRSVEAVTSLKEVQEEIRVLVGLLTAKEKVAEELRASEQGLDSGRLSASAKPHSANGAVSGLPSLESPSSVNELGEDANASADLGELLASGNDEFEVEAVESSDVSGAIEVSDWRQATGFHHESLSAPYGASSLQVALHYPLPSEIPADELLDPVDVFEILKEIVSRQGAAIQKDWDNTKPRERAFKSQTRLTLNAPTESAWPIVIRANKAFLRNAFHSLLLRAIESANSSGQGIVRVNFRVGLSALSISVEDNGRGFSEEKLRSLSFPETYMATGLASALESRPNFLGVSEIRERLEEDGNQFDFQARLGVGTRAILDFPRLDAYSSEKIRASKALLGEVETRRL